MTGPTGGILTPSQREFLRGIDLEDKSNSTKSMTRSRIVDRIQVSYIEDTPLIASSLTGADGYNSLTLERIADVEDREDFLEGLTLQVTLVRELAEAAGADPEEVIQAGQNRELATAEDRLRKKANQDPEDMTLREVRQLSGEIPQELRDHIDEIWEEVDKIRPGDIQSESLADDEGDLAEDVAKSIVEDLPEEDT